MEQVRKPRGICVGAEARIEALRLAAQREHEPGGGWWRLSTAGEAARDEPADHQEALEMIDSLPS